MSIIISQDGKKAQKVDKSDFEKEGYLQNYIHENPESIPVYEIEEDKKLSEHEKQEAQANPGTSILAKDILANTGSASIHVNTSYWGGLNIAATQYTGVYIDKLKELLTNNIDDYRIYAKMAQVLFMTGDANRANRAIKRAIFLRPDSAYLYNFQGIILSSRNMEEQALEAFLKAIKINKEFYSAYFNVGAILFKNK